MKNKRDPYTNLVPVWAKQFGMPVETITEDLRRATTYYALNDGKEIQAAADTDSLARGLSLLFGGLITESLINVSNALRVAFLYGYMRGIEDAQGADDAD